MVNMVILKGKFSFVTAKTYWSKEVAIFWNGVTSKRWGNTVPKRDVLTIGSLAVAVVMHRTWGIPACQGFCVAG